MIPGNVDPRRPDKVQRYKQPPTGNGNNPGDDLTPDYMNILGPETTTANAQGDTTTITDSLTSVTCAEQTQMAASNSNVQRNDPKGATGASNVIPTSPQYGVAIISDDTTGPNIDTTDAIKTSEVDKDLHATPSKNDRFKVVKIASSEPFKRGRWKCMDYVDQAPPVTVQQSKPAPQGATVVGGTVYMQTQSLPPQQIQQLLLQGAGYTAPPQYYPQSQMVPQQYFYTTPAGVQPQTMPQPIINPVPPNSVPPTYINTTQQPYYQATMANSMQNYHNVQFVPYQSQGSAFVPTTQIPTSMPMIAQAQTYTQSQSQSQPASQAPMVNGFAYSQVSEQQQAAAAPSVLPTQVAKNVLLNSVPQVVSAPQSVPIQHTEAQSTATVPIQALDPNVTFTQAQTVVSVAQPVPAQTPAVAAATTSVGESGEVAPPVQVTEGTEVSVAGGEESVDDPAKTNPVVNAIDNKIEQAMDLVKSHLMYTVREEVEVLKEKIAELMERIQQLESENNFLRSQIPKNTNANGTPNPDPSPQQ